MSIDFEKMFQRPPEAAEKPRLNPFQTEVRNTILTPGWRMIFEAGYAPIVRKWRQILLWQPDITETQRLGIQGAFTELYNGLRAAYEKAELEVPSWLRKEFEPDES